MPEVVLPYERLFDAPLADAYAWLTDYQDDDPDRAGHKVVQRRPVVERGKDRFVLDGTIEVAGRTMKGRATVQLYPPDRWVASFPNGTRYEYQLFPEGPARCRLVVRYRICVRRWSRWLGVLLGRGRILRDIGAMWDNFAASMARDLARA